MSLKEDLSAKIATKEDWQAYKRVWSTINSARYSKLNGIACSVPWWAQREAERIAQGVYEVTNVTEHLNSLGQFCLHVSSLDRSLVAFTPDVRSGEADRQQQISLGRFIVRQFPYYTDEYVQDLVAEHLADLSTELELLTGAEAIKNAYLTGPSSCMSKAYPNLPYHPVEAYDAPGISLAVMRDKEGRINARSLVFDGPDGRSYVRAYGDEKLLKRLGRLGIHRGPMTGAKFKVIPLNQEEDNNQFIFPYLDSGGGSSNVARIDNELVQVSDATLVAVRNINSRAGVSGTSAGGILTIENISSADFLQQDYITGGMFSTLTEEYTKIYHLGQVRIVQKCNIPHGTPIATVISVTTTKMLCLDQTFEHRERSYHSLTTYVDTKEVREYLGFVKLSAIYYPGEQDWVKDKDLLLTDEGYLKKADAIHYVTVDSGPRFKVVHHSQVQKSWTQVHSGDSKTKAYVSDKTCIRRTKSNRKVVPGYSGVVELWDGNYEFSRNTESFLVLSECFSCLRDQRPDVSVGSELWVKALTKRVNAYSSVERGVVGVLRNIGYSTRVRIDGEMVYLGESRLSVGTTRKALAILEKQLRENTTFDLQYVEIFQWYHLYMAETSPESYDDQGNVASTKIETPIELAELTQTIIDEHDQTKESDDPFQPETAARPVLYSGTAVYNGPVTTLINTHNTTLNPFDIVTFGITTTA